ncbi:hypothetical protein DP42_1384 [Burkholderia pseudomallei]|nr:hypothetical protein DP42_1384 [Burkholderia pseudomallei]
MFADVFVKVFRTIVGLENPQKPFEIEDALASIADALDSKDYQLGNRRSELISAQLLEAMEFLKKILRMNPKELRNPFWACIWRLWLIAKKADGMHCKAVEILRLR